MESACLQLIDSAEEAVHRSFNNYTFLTPDSQIAGLNVFAGFQGAELTTFSNNPQFDHLFPHPLLRNAPSVKEAAAIHIPQTHLGSKTTLRLFFGKWR